MSLRVYRVCVFVCLCVCVCVCVPWGLCMWLTAYLSPWSTTYSVHVATWLGFRV